MRKYYLLVIVGFFFAFCSSIFAESLNVSFNEEYLSILYGPRKIADYRYSKVPFKPYVKELFTPSGLQVLEDAPSGHLHHHGLMFAVGVDDINFWEEVDKSGSELHQKFSDINIQSNAPIPLASFVEQLNWKSPEQEQPKLIETRKISAGYWQQENANVLLWNTMLENPSESQSVKLTGHHYFGLGARLIETLPEKVEIISLTEDNLENVRGDEYLRDSPWCAMVVKNDAGTFTLLMVDSTKSVRFPPRWFTMRIPFVYISATRNLWKEPFEVKPKEKALFNHILVLWDGEKSKEYLGKVAKNISNFWE